MRNQGKDQIDQGHQGCNGMNYEDGREGSSSGGWQVEVALAASLGERSYESGSVS